ncbi:MAG: N-acetyltransferase [Betaproteobacteria bacterium]|jgi:predicted GNAT family acetyltransferase|nr:N-acetyltransferase [Betaproteobacteria bacterium]MBP6645973.1 N-acetyltransferase [Burkholderiaceae bacterium]
MDITDFVHDQAKQQFRLTVDKHIALVDYVMHGNKLMLTHSEVPFALRGQGVGKVLVDKTFAYLRDHGLQAHAVCSYIRVVAKRDPQWQEIVST